MTEESQLTALDDPDRPTGGSELQHAETAEGVLQLARQLLERGSSDEALAVIQQYAAGNPAELPSPVGGSQPVFDAGISDRELELAFESAETDPEQMLDADEIAERAIRQTDMELRSREGIPAVEHDFVESGASYATRTVAQLLERQGDAPAASRIREIVDSSDASEDSSTAVSSGSAPLRTGIPKPQVRDRRTSAIMELERWLVNLRGVAQ